MPPPRSVIRYAGALHTNERGQVEVVGTNRWGDVVTAARNLRVRGRDTDGQGRLFSHASGGAGASTAYDSATGMHTLTSGTAAGGHAYVLHNDVLHYVETHPVGFVITTKVSSTEATPVRVEWGLFSGYASSASALRSTDGFGFYWGAGVLGVWVRNTLTAGSYPGNTVDVPRSSWDDPLDGSGRSGISFSLEDLLGITVLSAAEVWLGAHGVEWRIGNVVVHERDFRWDEGRILVPNGRYPDRRPGVYAYNSAPSEAVTVHVNCLSGYRDTDEYPKTQEVTAERQTARTALVDGAEVPFAAFRVALTHHWRQLYPHAVKVRCTGQNTRVKVRLGTDADFALTGYDWQALPENQGSGIEQSVTDMGWTNAGTGQLVASDVAYPSNDETLLLDLEKFFLSHWVGVDGNGAQRVLLFTATALVGSNAAVELAHLRGMVFG